MGGKPSKTTKPDMRLAENKAKYGTSANRDAKVQQKPAQPPKKGN